MVKTSKKPNLHGGGTCNICGIFFRSLQMHKNKGCRPRFCRICNLIFDKPISYQMHVKAVHGNKKTNRLICEVCRKPLDSTYSLKNHMKHFHNLAISLVHFKSYVTCDMCHHKLNPIHLYQHITDCHHLLCNGNLKLSPKDPVFCTSCETTITPATLYAVHVYSNHGLNIVSSERSLKLQCGRCSFTTTDAQQFEVHQRAHLSEKQTPKQPNHKDSHVPSFSSTDRGDIAFGFSLSVGKKSHDNYKEPIDKPTTYVSLAPDITSNNAASNNSHDHHIELRTDGHLPGTGRYYYCVTCSCSLPNREAVSMHRKTQRVTVKEKNVLRVAINSDNEQHNHISSSNKYHKCNQCNREFNCPSYANIHRKICHEFIES